jgi:hypothetical protein
MTTPSMNGFLYYIIFIDDCSHKTWTYVLKTKMNLSTDFNISRILLKIRKVDISEFLELKIVNNLTPTSMMNSAGILGLRGR